MGSDEWRFMVHSHLNHIRQRQNRFLSVVNRQFCAITDSRGLTCTETLQANLELIIYLSFFHQIVKDCIMN